LFAAELPPATPLGEEVLPTIEEISQFARGQVWVRALDPLSQFLNCLTGYLGKGMEHELHDMVFSIRNSILCVCQGWHPPPNAMLVDGYV
jgi:hypothetical protein